MSQTSGHWCAVLASQKHSLQTTCVAARFLLLLWIRPLASAS